MAEEQTTDENADAAEAEQAAENAEATEAPPAEAGVSAEALTAAEAQGWVGFKLDDLGGSTVGKIEAVYLDSRSGDPEWLLARMGRFGHHCLVPARDAVGAAGHVWVPYSRDQIRKAPRMEAGQPLEREAEETLLEHYGVGASSVGRGADLAERDPGAVTARAAQQ
jgi:hypothetical protein